MELVRTETLREHLVSDTLCESPGRTYGLHLSGTILR